MPRKSTETNPHAGRDVVRVDIVLDVACVWSYLGYARFLRAAARHRAAGGTIEVTFRPFQVASDAPVDGEPLSEVHTRDFGADATQKEARMTELAAQSGVEMNFDRAVYANTFQAHRLIALAAEQGRAEAMVERLFRAYFTDGLNVADAHTLAHLAAEVGVAWSDSGTDKVQSELARVRGAGITAVPQFVIQGGHRLEGAQAEETLLSAFDDAAHRLASPIEPASRAHRS